MVMFPARLPALATLLAGLALALAGDPALADRPDDRPRHGHHKHERKDDRADRRDHDRRDADRPPVIVIGRTLPRDAYRILDPDLYARSYGRRIDDRYRYAETLDGTRILIDLASGVIAEILVDALAPGLDLDRPRVATSGLDIPPGHLPPQGLCRVWYPDLPPGHQPAPGSCNVRVPRGAVLIGG